MTLPGTPQGTRRRALAQDILKRHPLMAELRRAVAEAQRKADESSVATDRRDNLIRLLYQDAPSTRAMAQATDLSFQRIAQIVKPDG